MLHYPKIPGSSAAPLGKCVAFEKLDGTNLHWCWHRPHSPLCASTMGAVRATNSEFGWHAFGTRRDEFNLTPDGEAAFGAAHPGLEEASPVFRATLAGPLDALLRDHPNYAEFTAVKVFAEFLGDTSFAGAHEPNDPKRTVLFDVWAEGYGFVSPQQFVSDFGHWPTPRVVYTGKLTGAFLEAVREGKYGVGEGVVCKGGTGGEDVWMVKVKTYAYLERLKKSFGARWEDFWE
jgi:hypothetical protein